MTDLLRDRLAVLLDRVKDAPRAFDEPPPVCAACNDTLFVEVDDGLVDGRRVGQAVVRRCNSILHLPAPNPRTEESFA